MADKNKALFICLVNICRSPIAEGVFQKTVNDLGLSEQWEIDSAAIDGWHIGNSPDWRALDTMKNHGVPYNNCARQLVSDDFKKYDYIFGMDQENMGDLKSKAPKGSKAKLLLFGDFDPQGDRIIRDPYYKRAVRAIYKMRPRESLREKFKEDKIMMVHTSSSSDSGAEGFEKCYQQSVRCSKGFLDQLEKGQVK